MSQESRKNTVEMMRHSFTHVLAMAVLRVFKDTKLGIGPAVENGFYHDFQFTQPIGNDELKQIENEIKRIIEEELPFKKIMVSKENAFDILHLQGQIYKTEILKQLKDQEVTFYKTGQEFMDLCRGPHVDHTGNLGVFKLIGISGIHWNGDESRPIMQRIHGLAFKTETELNDYLQNQKNKLEQDHRKLGIKLELFDLEPKNGRGFPIWMPKGAAVQRLIKNHLYKENLKLGFQHVQTPLISKTEVFNRTVQKVPGSQTLFPLLKVNRDTYLLKPKSNPFYYQIYKSKKRSYRNLPFRISETDTLFRYEKSGELSGLSKVRQFTNDSNIVICTKEQLKNELVSNLISINNTMHDFGLEDFKIELALQGPNTQYKGNQKDWLRLQNLLIEAGKTAGLTIFEGINSASAIGPSINYIFKDVAGHSWRLGNITIDIESPVDYKLNYIDQKNKKIKPFVFYRSTVGSLERFFAILIEKYGGAFPLWISPVHAYIIPISAKFEDYAKQIQSELIDNDINVELDLNSETMQNKIRKAQKEMVPYMVIVGDKEESTNTISIRPRSGQDLGIMKLEEFMTKIKYEIKEKVNF